MRHDLIVIGAGPGGTAAALQGAKLGLDVAIVEHAAVVGGACVNTGTIPSKSLREAILSAQEARRATRLGAFPAHFHRPSLPDLMRRKSRAIQNQVETLHSFLERNQVRVVPGTASFVSRTELSVAGLSGAEAISAPRIVIATGSRPRRPASLPFDDRLVLDSDSILGLEELPRSLSILGAGVIGCEYACMFATLGVKVNLVDRRARMLRFLDEDILDALHFSMRRMGVRIMPSEACSSVAVERTRHGEQVVIELESGRVVRSERLLVAAGRQANTDPLRLAAAGIEVDADGLIKVDDRYCTSQPGVYAIGDVIGFPALAGTSMHQGRLAVLDAADQAPARTEDLPIAIYTIPEISMAGLTEEACRQSGIVYETGVARYSEIPRGQIRGDMDGMLKLVFRRDDRVLLGVHMIGEASAELIHLGIVLLHAGGSVEQLADSVFNYPTLSEAYRVAALDGLNRV